MYSLIKVFHTQFCAISRITITHRITHSESQNATAMKRLNLYWLLSINTKINTSAINMAAKWHCSPLHNLRENKCSQTVFHLLEGLKLQKFLFSCFYIKTDSHGNFFPIFKSVSSISVIDVSTFNLPLKDFIKHLKKK